MTLAGKLNWVSRPLGQPLPLTEAVALYTELKTILEDSFRPIPPAQLIDLKPRDLAGYEREVKSLFNRAADEPSKKYFQQFLDHGGRTLDDFTGGYAVGQVFGKDADF